MRLASDTILARLRSMKICASGSPTPASTAWTRPSNPAPWGGAAVHDLMRESKACRENPTPRIGETTMEPLLDWFLRTIEELAPDITAA